MADPAMANRWNLPRIMAAIVWTASAAVVGLAFYTARITGYEYGALASFRAYNGILAGSAFVLAVVLLVGVLTFVRVDRTARALLRQMGEELGTGALPSAPDRLKGAVRAELAQTPNLATTQDLERSLKAYESAVRLRRDLRVLVAAPVGLLSAIFAVSAWALPATEGLLQSLPWLNTSLLFFVSYGMVVAAASALLVMWVLLSADRRATA